MLNIPARLELLKIFSYLEFVKNLLLQFQSLVCLIMLVMPELLWGSMWIE